MSAPLFVGVLNIKKCCFFKHENEDPLTKAVFSATETERGCKQTESTCEKEGRREGVWGWSGEEREQ